MRFYRFLIAGICMMMLCACASSRKTMTRVSVIGGDSVTKTVADSVAVSTVRKDSARVDRWDYSQTIGSIVDYNNDEELIHELITVATDSLGNKTTTTDRTIRRKNNHGKQTTISEEQRRKEEQTSVLLSALDSIVHSSFSNYYNHWLNRDSVMQNKGKTTGIIFSPTKHWTDGVILFCVLCFVVWYAWKYGQEIKK